MFTFLVFRKGAAAGRPPTHRRGAAIFIFFAMQLFTPQVFFQKLAAADKPTPALTWADAARRTLERNPDLAAADMESAAADGRVLQAGLKPNPQLSMEVENVGGSGNVGLAQSMELTFQYEHTLERGGKRLARVAAAETDREVVLREADERRSELLSAAAEAFLDVRSAQERLANRLSLLDLAERIHETVKSRVEAGKVSPVEETRSLVALESARMEVDKVRREMEAGRDRLASAWGAAADFTEVRSPFGIPSVPLTVEGPNMDANPTLRRAAAAVQSRRAALALESASRKQDLTLSGGVRYFNYGRDVALVGGLSVPLGVRDKRQGLIAEATARLEQARRELAALHLKLKSKWTQARHAFESSREESARLSDRILPESRKAMEALEEGYRYGRFDFLSVLDAQRTHVEMEGRYVEAVGGCLKAAVEMYRISSPGLAGDTYSFLNDTSEARHE